MQLAAHEGISRGNAFENGRVCRTASPEKKVVIRLGEEDGRWEERRSGPKLGRLPAEAARTMRPVTVARGLPPRRISGS